MLGASLARRYARALFDLALEAGQVQEVGEALDRVLGTLAERRDLRALWEHQEVSARVKRTLVDEILAAEAPALVRNFLALLVTRRRERWLEAIRGEYERLADEALGRVEVEVRAAVPPAAGVLGALEDRLGRRLGKQVKLRVRIEPELVGGLVVRVGDVLFDGSVRTRLRRMQERLARAGASPS